MSDPKKKIKQWLKENKKDRFWLAEKCLVTKKTIDDWLTSRGSIPETKMKLIHQLMGPPVSSTAHSLNEKEQQQIFLDIIARRLEEMIRTSEAELFHDFSLDELEKAKDTAKRQGLTPKEYLIISFLHQVTQFIENSSTNSSIYDKLKKWKDSEQGREE